MRPYNNEIKTTTPFLPFGVGGALSIIVAASTNNAIGRENMLLWHLPNDMKFFKSKTWAMPVIMGRKTFESMGSKPLNGRPNIIISRQQNFNANGTTSAINIEDALNKAISTNCKEIFIIGGGEIYKESLPMVSTIYLTRVHTTIDGDTFFPPINHNEWQLISQQDFFKDAKHNFDYSFEHWIRIA